MFPRTTSPPPLGPFEGSRYRISSMDPLICKGHYTQTWVRLKFFGFDSTQSQKVFIPIQHMTQNGFQDLIQINTRLDMVFWNLIQIDS